MTNKMDDVDELEKGAERALPKISKVFREYYLLFILGLLVVVTIATYFGFALAINAKKTMVSQDLMQQQIDLQKSQLEEQAKEASKTPTSTTPAETVPPVTATVPKTPAPVTSTCDKAKQREQIAVFEKFIPENEARIVDWQNKIAATQVKINNFQPTSSNPNDDWDKSTLAFEKDALQYNVSNRDAANNFLNKSKNSCTIWSDTLVNNFR